MRSVRFYSNDTLCRMQAMFERSCADLGIDGNSDYAQSAREALAHMMFELPPSDESALLASLEEGDEVAKHINILLKTISGTAVSTPEKPK